MDGSFAEPGFIGYLAGRALWPSSLRIGFRSKLRRNPCFDQLRITPDMFVALFFRQVQPVQVFGNL